MPRKKPVTRWEGRLGIWPHVVWYGELPKKGGVCYLRWWIPERENWGWESCRTKVRDARGAFSLEQQNVVIAMAKRRHDLLLGILTEDAVPAPLTPITLQQTWAVLTDPETGRYPTSTAFRKELKRAIDDATKVLGGHFAWLHFDDTAFLRVTRKTVVQARAGGHTGHAIAESVGKALIAIMGALKDARRVPANVATPGGRRWKKDLKRFVADLQGGIEPEPARPRHSLAEMRLIMARAREVDPRFELLMALGAELRLGQVVRARRSMIDREKGLFRSPGSGSKQGAIVELTAGQRAVFERAITTGYLGECERALADYQLFPMRTLIHGAADPKRHGTRRPVHRRTINQWFRDAEKLAGVAHQDGRGAYSLRRRAVDEGTDGGISPEGLKELGGWSTDRTPQGIYRSKNRAKAQHEASEVRARIRGEEVQNPVPGVAESYPATPTAPTEP